MSTSILIFFAILCFAFSNHVMGFSFLESPLVEPSNSPHIGSTLIMTCVSSSPHEHCTWKHNNNECRFDWDTRHRHVKNTYCKDYGERLSFHGIYEAQQCKIRLTEVTESDAGKWTCELNNNKRRVAKDININVIPRPDRPHKLMNNDRKVKSQEKNNKKIPPPADQQNVTGKEDGLLRLLHVLLCAK